MPYSIPSNLFTYSQLLSEFVIVLHLDNLGEERVIVPSQDTSCWELVVNVER